MVIQNEVIKSTTKFDSYFDDGKNPNGQRQPNNIQQSTLVNPSTTKAQTQTPEELPPRPKPPVDEEDDVNFI